MMIDSAVLLRKINKAVEEIQAEQRALRGHRVLRSDSPKRAMLSELACREIGVHIVREMVLDMARKR